MSKDVIIFRLKNGMTPASWSIKGGSAVNAEGELKHIGYFPGSKSIYVEDNNDDRKQEEVVFEYNDELTDPATEIRVDISNKILIEYLQAHAFFNVHYEIHSTDAISEGKLADFEKTEKALKYINEDDDVKTKAIAVAVFKTKAAGWSLITCKAELKETAIKNPKLIIDAVEDKNYESNYLAALAFYSGIIAENQLHTAVVWVNGGGEIMKLALGENGIEKLGALLALQTEESKLLFQEIGIRVDQKSQGNVAASKPVNVPTGKTEAQIREELRAEMKEELKAEALAEAKAMLESEKGDGAKIDTATNTDSTNSEVTKKTELGYDATDLAQVQAKYKEVLKKDLPVNKKGDIEWLNSKIAENNI